MAPDEGTIQPDISVQDNSSTQTALNISVALIPAPGFSAILHIGEEKMILSKFNIFEYV